MHTSAVPARWDCLARSLYHSGPRARPLSTAGCRSGAGIEPGPAADQLRVLY